MNDFPENSLTVTLLNNNSSDKNNGCSIKNNDLYIKSFGEPIVLNIGGVEYYTTRGTLTNEKESYFDILFSGNYNINLIKKENKPDTLFIDRDGSHFRYILNYLRGDINNLPKCPIIRGELFVEADFYCLQGLKQILYPYHFYQSKILPQFLSNDLIKLIKDSLQIKKTTLIYRASENNFSASLFHELCDFAGPTITIVKSKDNIFGGFTSKYWSPSTQYQLDDQMFLFDLSNLPPVLIKKSGNQNFQTIYSNIKYGPVFGLLHQGLTISSDCNINKDSYFEQYYDFKGKGKKNYKIEEYEVFKIDI
ncbi:hypothetical protein DICPUDRAFT_46038 [Dictyostelium purpureum]|uniref:BTB domain-containing protein n=1 Tax=Dictyostelium purpureum TaxID=5786 RepID=F0ZD86_DICPU|nr:uncharacterized protein DICPUDRAFT_46038 [Dictyostelium purpureum]EGC38093.1 hypothetical protein DICPUDRAFT_46038 [Dictyostelium purpureum]|eukprot:XP_003285400.1 hypothetical protein DICPUDRAFT_46038 [Dictyostelium purpureum]